MYRDGDGVAVDRDEALMWYVPLALSDHAVAQFELAQMIEADAAGPNDRDAALHWYRKAAAAGDDQAARRLAADKPGGGREGETPSLASQVGSGAAARP